MGKPIIRVLHILQRMEAGGTQALLMNIYRKIDRSKVQFDFLVEYAERQFYDEEIKRLGGKIYYSSVREDLNLLRFGNYLRKILIDNLEYKIVHVHTYSIGYFCLKIAKKAGVPVRIAHSHSNAAVYNLKYIIKIVLQKIYTIYATDLFACSEEAGTYLFKKKPFQVLPNAIASENFIAKEELRNEIRGKLKLSNKFVIGHVGRMQPEKNHDFVIDVFEKIKEKRPDAMLILVGTGPLEETIRQKVLHKGISEYVYFLGNHGDMNRIYQAMDVLVFPSLYEGLGIVAIEAQAAGIPLVCSKGVPEEANISPLYRKLMLSDGAGKWADVAIEMSQNKYSHTNMQKYVINAGFDINLTAQKMESYYLKIYETRI